MISCNNGTYYIIGGNEPFSQSSKNIVSLRLRPVGRSKELGGNKFLGGQDFSCYYTVRF